jgi:hypothetical protein
MIINIFLSVIIVMSAITGLVAYKNAGLTAQNEDLQAAVALYDANLRQALEQMEELKAEAEKRDALLLLRERQRNQIAVRLKMVEGRIGVLLSENDEFKACAGARLPSAIAHELREAANHHTTEDRQAVPATGAAPGL